MFCFIFPTINRRVIGQNQGKAMESFRADWKLLRFESKGFFLPLPSFADWNVGGGLDTINECESTEVLVTFVEFELDFTGV